MRRSAGRPILGLGVLLCLVLPGPVRAQGPSPLEALDSVTGIRTLSRAFFEGKALYGYINGGAEVYHEYGFRRLEVRTVTAGRETLSVEAYEMRDPFGAFGILTVSRGGCSPDSALGPFSFTSPYQSQAAIGPLYLRVVEGKGRRFDPDEGRRILRTIGERGEAGVLDLQGLFEGELPPGDPADIVAVRGTLGLQNGWDGWTDLFEGLEGYELAILPAEGEEVCAGAVRFTAAEGIEAFRGRWSMPTAGGRVRSSRMKGERLLLLETSGSGPLATAWRHWFER